MPNQENSAGPIIATIIILAVIILGGLYFWGARSDYSGNGTANVESASDETAALEDALDDINTNDLDGELNAS